MNFSIKNIIFGVFVILLQVLALNNVNVGGFINPYIYPLIILVLPFDMKPWITLILAFFIGLLVDLFTGTLGMHAFSLVFMTALRPYFIKTFSLDKFEQGRAINIKTQDSLVVFVFIALLFLAHHFVYFLLESFNFLSFGNLTLRTLLSSMISIIIALILLFIFKSPSKK